MIGSKVCIVGGPAGRPVYRRIASLTSRGITCRLALSDGLLVFSWDGRFVSGPGSFQSAQITQSDIARIRRGDDTFVPADLILDRVKADMAQAPDPDPEPHRPVE